MEFRGDGEWKDGTEGGNTFAVVGGDCAVVELE